MRSAFPVTDMSIGYLLRRGLAAGAAAGALAAVFFYLVVEPVVRRALVIEEARGHADGGGHSHEEPLVSRSMQVFGGIVTVTVAGLLFGLVFAVVYAWSRNRLPGGSDFGRVVVLAGLGFAVFTLLPALRLPANPPAVGDPESVTRRTLIYVLTILVGLMIVLALFALDRAFVDRGLDVPRRVALAVVVAVVGLTLLFLLVPGSPDEIPADMPADILWDLRVASLAMLGVLWTVLGVGFGLLVSPRSAAARAAEPAKPAVAG
jgi:predicted cobalt transporter CbtA